MQIEKLQDNLDSVIDSIEKAQEDISITKAQAAKCASELANAKPHELTNEFFDEIEASQKTYEQQLRRQEKILASYQQSKAQLEQQIAVVRKEQLQANRDQAIDVLNSLAKDVNSLGYQYQDAAESFNKKLSSYHGKFHPLPSVATYDVLANPRRIKFLIFDENQNKFDIAYDNNDVRIQS